MDRLKNKPEQPAKWMADAFGMKPAEVMGMRNDSHPTNFAENVQFFLNASNPTNFERTWKNAAYVYRELGRISAPVQFDQVLDLSMIQSLQKKGTFAQQTDESVASFTPASFRITPAEAPLQAVRDLSLTHANAMKRALIEQYKFDPNKFSNEGTGWHAAEDAPAPNVRARNRRVEITVFPPQQK